MLWPKIILFVLSIRLIQTSAIPWKYGINFPESNTNNVITYHERIQIPRALTTRDIFQSIGSILREQFSENGVAMLNFILTQLRTLDDTKKNNPDKDDPLSSDLKSLNIPTNRTSRFVNFAIDLIVKLTQPYLGPRGFIILVTIIRPILVAAGISMMNNGANLMKNFMNQEPILDSNLLKDPSYEAYPVFIPGYGSYILLSDAGSLGPPNIAIDEEAKTLETTTTKMKTSVNVIQTGNGTNLVLDNNKTASVNISVSDNSTSKDNYSNTNALLKIVYNTTTSESNVQNSESLFLGQTHLIPIADRPHIFENVKDLLEADWSGETDAVLRDNIKEIVRTRVTVRSIKKRIILNILKRIEQNVLKM